MTKKDTWGKKALAKQIPKIEDNQRKEDNDKEEYDNDGHRQIRDKPLGWTMHTRIAFKPKHKLSKMHHACRIAKMKVPY